MTIRNKVDLNSDVGESFGIYKLGLDKDLIPLISSANIACGFHAGDPSVMQHTVSIAKKHGVAVGAHPGFPDLLGFGRRNMDISLTEIRDYVVYQIGALQAFVAMAGLKLQHVKAHGALYNMGVHRVDIYEAIAKAVAGIDKDLILVVMSGPARKELEGIGNKYGIRIAFEAFADRGYNPDGTLVSRKEPGAVLGDPLAVSDRIVKMVKEGKVVVRDGSEIELKADTVCLHGDNPAALTLVQTIRESCAVSGVEIAPLGSFL
jgi:UPF0271 protein